MHQFSSVTQSCPTLCDPMDCSMPGFPVCYQLLVLKLMFITSVMPSNHLVRCRPLLLLPSIFPTLRVFSSESVVIRWSKYWSFSFSISPSNEYSNAYYSENDTALMVEVMGVSSRSWRVLLFPFYLCVMAKKLQ